MQITVTGRHTDVPAALRDYAVEKAGKLDRYYDRVQSVDVIFDRNAGDYHCEVIARADHHLTFVAKEAHAEPFAALDISVKDLEKQLTRHKEKHRNRKHSGAARSESEPLGGPGTEAVRREASEGGQ